MYAYLWYYSLRRNTKGYDGKTYQTDSQNSDTTAPSVAVTPGGQFGNFWIHPLINKDELLPEEPSEYKIFTVNVLTSIYLLAIYFYKIICDDVGVTYTLPTTCQKCISYTRTEILVAKNSVAVRNVMDNVIQ
jgi:hypothetical protein